MFDFLQIRRKSKPTEPKIDPIKAVQQENIGNHNQTIEDHLFENELSKFKNDIENKNKLPQISTQKRSILYINIPKFEIDNSYIYQSLEDCQELANDFYQSAIEAGSRLNNCFTNVEEDECRFIEIKDDDELDEKGVHFGDTQVITYQPIEASSHGSIDESDEEDFSIDEDLFLETLDSDVETFDEFEFQSSESMSDLPNDHRGSDSYHTDTEDCITVTRTDVDLCVRRINPADKDYSKLVITNYRAESEEETASLPQESFKIINEVFRDSCNKNYDLALMKQYFFKWMQVTILEKIARGVTGNVNCEKKLKKINDFINNVRMDKKRSMALKKFKEPISVKRDFEHRLKVQQDIIELQKLKLERQERIITELKLSKFVEAARISKKEIKTELKNAMRTGNVRLRAKAKCIQISGNIKQETTEEDHLRMLQAQGIIMPKFLAKMQERALERSMKHEEAKERRLRLEKEREEAKTAAEEAKRLEDEEARKRRYKEMREKRKLEKMMKIHRELERQRMVANFKIAKEYQILHLKRLGLRAFRLVLQQRKNNERKAVSYRRKYFVRKYFRKWSKMTRQLWEKKRSKANVHYHRKLMKLGLRLWKEVKKKKIFFVLANGVF